jgi:acetyltransferase-like isoleucine patch superfamily enzyme
MNAVIMPNVELGDHTIVAAGSVVTKAFPNGYCVLAGNPAKQIKTLQKETCIEYKNPFEYYGYIKKEEFAAYRKKYLRV